MRKYPATLVRVFENKLEASANTGDDITFDENDLKQATDELDINVRQVLEIPSAYSSTRALPDEIMEYGCVDIEPNESDQGETYQFVTE
ncbi:hypothetical protein [Natronococcus wangiae]|uniref:hypothetical protein n=1 Tax=Natronococcus wangiae TaxID=3068275 RepID=UPI00273D4994|nr:hypothetical protein [Natronococcus sp. AD5]